MLRRLHLFLMFLHRSALRHPKKMLLLMALMVLIALPFAGQLKFLLAIDDLIEPGFKTYDSLQKLKSNFKDSQNILLSIEAREPGSITAPMLCDLQKWILDLSDQRRDLLKISSSFGLRQAELQGRLLKFKTVLDVDCPTEKEDQERIAQGLDKIQKSPWGKLLGSNREALTLSISFAPDESNLKYGQFRTESVGEIRDSFQQAMKPWLSKVDVHWGGVAVYQAELRKSFDQTQALNGLMFILAALIFRFFLRSWKAGFLFIGTIILTLIVTYGLMGATSVPIDVLTNATGLMLIISCLQDFVFITYGSTFLGYGWRKSMRKFLIPSFYTSMTTVIGFGSLGVSDLSIIRRFGLVSAFAAALEWFVVFVVLPALLTVFQSKIWPQARIQAPGSLSKVMELQWPRWISICLLVAIPVGIWGSWRLRVEDSPEKFFSQAHFVNRESAHFLQSRGWKAEISLLLEKNLPTEERKRILDEVSQWSQITSVESRELTEKYLVSSVLDQRDQKAILSLWEESPFSSRLIGPEAERAVLYLNTTERADLEALMKKTLKVCPTGQCELSSGLISYVEFGDRVLKTLFESLFVSLLLVAGILFFLGQHLKVRNLPTLILSSVWGPLALLAFFYTFQVSVFFVSTICASVLVGLSGDNTIQFLFASKKEGLAHSVQGLGMASLVVSVGMMVLTAVFYLSPIWPLQKLGSLMILGFALAWIGDVLILKGFIKA